jgi:hypothetical protein
VRLDLLDHLKQRDLAQHVGDSLVKKPLQRDGNPAGWEDPALKDAVAKGHLA